MDLGQVGEDVPRSKRLRAESEVEDSGRLVRQAQTNRDECIRAAERDAGKREAKKLLHLSLALPRSCLSACRAQAGDGVPAGSGNTGSFFGLIDSKQLRTFFPSFSVGTYLFPSTLM